MDLKLQDKVVLVTGGSKGIGKAISLSLSKEGCKVAICARGQEGVDEALAELQGKGTVIGQAVDVLETPD